MRQRFAEGDYAEVYVSTPLAVCEQRDTKGLYKLARAGKLRILAVILAAGIGLAFAYLAIYRRGEDDAATEKLRQRLLAQRRTAPDQSARAEAASAPSADARGQLRVLAQAAGLMVGRDETHTDWLVQDLPGDAIQLALRTQPDCRLVVKRQPVGGRIEMQVFLSEC